MWQLLCKLYLVSEGVSRGCVFPRFLPPCLLPFYAHGQQLLQPLECAKEKVSSVFVIRVHYSTIHFSFTEFQECPERRSKGVV